MAKKIGREKYEVFVDKDNILQVYDQQYPTEESARNVLRDVADLMKKHHIKRAIVDLTGQDFKALSFVRKQMAETISKTIRQYKVEKVAITGTSSFIRIICNFMFSGGKIVAPRFFDTREEALDWLKK